MARTITLPSGSIMNATRIPENAGQDQGSLSYGNTDRIVEEATSLHRLDAYHFVGVSASIRPSFRLQWPGSTLTKRKEKTRGESSISTYVQDSIAPLLTIKSDLSEELVTPENEGFVAPAYRPNNQLPSLNVQVCKTHSDVDGDRGSFGLSGRLERPFDKTIKPQPYARDLSQMSEATSLCVPAVETSALDGHCQSAELTASSG